MKQIWPSAIPKARAASGSTTSFTTWISRKWLPAPSVPSCGKPLWRALALTAPGSAPGIAPSSSHRTRSSSMPNPRSTAHRAPFTMTSESSLFETRRVLFAPTPVGTALKNLSIRSRFLPARSASVRGVVIRRTPQLMSNPTPPGDMTPSVMSNAATPPMGNPYPQWMSGMASECFTIPGRVATFASWRTAPSSSVSARAKERKKRPGTRISETYPMGTSHSRSPILLIPSSMSIPHISNMISTA
ncbi:MAG: hypothetical protein BWX50_01645 [Euryarchaeota archaeon ADurb.Bin009]|nr:MAG: hypothetical protein BWX50_01645 [Euryarchaeota archaeon ADurb.Bin009]